MSIAVNGFQKCGIWPLNEDMCEEHEIEAALTTDRPMPPTSTMPPGVLSYVNNVI